MDARSRFTPAVRQLIVDGLAAGMPIRHACALARIDSATFYRWRLKGEAAKPGTTWHTFYQDCEEAQAASAAHSLAVITTAATDGDWRAAAWKLEHRFPSEYGIRDRAAAPAGPVVIELAWPGSPAAALAAAPSSVVEIVHEPVGGEPDSA